MHLDYQRISLSHLNSRKGIESAASMRVMLIMRERKKTLAQIPLPERVLNNKLEAYKFIDSLGIRRPQLISEKNRHDELPPRLTNAVIKPVSGRSSRGVYAVFNEDVIKTVKTAERFSGREKLLEHLKSDLQSGVAKEDRWMIEELITDEDNPLIAARDLKFYCFYGRVELVVEAIRDPITCYCLWDRDCRIRDVGCFEDQLFVGRGFTPAMRAMAERISAEIPAPFMRIDFHATGSELVFCEFTPTSGGIWDYNRETDQFLGSCYLEAEARLLTDLVNGKQFDTYRAFYAKYRKSHKQILQKTREAKPVEHLH